MAKALAQFTAAGLVAMLVLLAVGSTALHRTGAAEALHQADLLTRVQERAVRPQLTDGLVAGDPAALAALDAAVRRTVLTSGVERVKVWSPDGRIVYADDPRQIGQRFTLGPDELTTLRTGRAASGVSMMRAPENRMEPSGHRLLEVYERTASPQGSPLLFESYLRYDSVVASGNRLWTDFMPALLATLLAFELLQLPLAWRLVRRLQQGRREREALYRHAAHALDAERRRITADLHDGVVQTLAGVGYSLAAAAADVVGPSPASAAATAETISGAAAMTRRSISELRSLLVDIYPPSLREAGLCAALTDLLAPLPGRGVTADLSIPDRIELAPEVEELLYRAAQEAVRNVLTHAAAKRVHVEVRREADNAFLDVRDNGRGFVVGGPGPGNGSHFGLRLLHEMTDRRGGRLRVDSVPGCGTSLHLEVAAL